MEEAGGTTVMEEDEDELAIIASPPVGRGGGDSAPFDPVTRGVRGMPSKGEKDVPGEKRTSTLWRRGCPRGKEKFS